MNGMLYVYKSMLHKLQNEWRGPLIFILLASMMVALFISRALLSVTMISFVLVSFFHGRPGQQLKIFFSSPLLWTMSLLFLLPLLSGAWSSDRDQWVDILRIKIPLLFLPLAFAAPFHISPRLWLQLSLIFLLLLACTSVWSIFLYLSNMSEVNESYLQAKTMLTPLENDHVRYSWLVAIAILLASWTAWKRRQAKDLLFWVLVVTGAWLMIYLHVLAVRTGLISFYIILFGLITWAFISQKRRGPALSLLMILLLLPMAAYLVFPSFRNRISYMRYDFSYFRDARYLPGANDAVRLISMRTGWELMKDAPLTGVGFGDIDEESRKKYAAEYPSMLERDKILPGSEWIMYGAGTGWPGFIIFTLVMTVPFFTRVRERLCWWLMNITAAFSFVFDIGLEVQFGVFVYSFVVLWWWKWLVTEKV
jgi:O-antigen ligase